MPPFPLFVHQGYIYQMFVNVRRVRKLCLQYFNSAEPKAIVKAVSVVRRRPSSSVHNFKRVLLRNHWKQADAGWADCKQILQAASRSRGNELLFKRSLLHDQHGSHGKNLKLSFSLEPMCRWP